MSKHTGNYVVFDKDTRTQARRRTMEEAFALAETWQERTQNEIIVLKIIAKF